MGEVKREGFAVDHAHRPHFGLIVIILFGLVTLTGCAKSTDATSADTSQTTSSASDAGTVLTKADQQISHQKIAAAQATLATVKTPSAAVKNLATGLKYYERAADALAKNQLSTAKGYFTTLMNYQGTTDATFIAARTKLDHQYQQVKLANGYYNTARDELSMHELSLAKNNIDKLDAMSTVHPVIKQLQKKALSMKQAIMNYEASQSTSTGSASSTVTSSSSASSDGTSTTKTNSTSSSSADSSSASSSSGSTATSSATSTSSSSSSSLTDAQALKQFKQSVGITFASGDQFEITSRTNSYYQITVTYATDSSADSDTSTSDTYRYYPTSGNVTTEDPTTGDFE